MEEVIREGALRLLTSETSCDVILSCHGRRMMAHKIILSIASPLLRDLLIEDVTTEPTVLIFPEISGYTMSLILDYVYTGNVTIPPIYLKEFVVIANLLKLKLDDEYLTNYTTSIPQQNVSNNNNNNNIGKDIVTIEDLSNIKKAKDVVSIDDIINDNYSAKNRNQRINFNTFNYLDDNSNVTCKRGRKMPNLLPITTYKRRKELFNKVFPSPWCPRGSPLLKHPREDCHSTNLNSYQLLQHHQQEQTKEILQENDTNNNNYQSNYLQYQYNYDALSDNYFCNNNNGLISCQPLLTNTVTTSTTIPIQEVAEIHQTIHDNDRINCESKQLTKVPIKLDETLHDETVKKQLQKQQTIVESNPERDAAEEIATKCNDEHVKQAETRNDKLKPFKCEDCGKGFSQLRNYKYHRSIHEGTREFSAKCPECGKIFNDKAYLSSHMKIHRDKKEYACPHCPKRFNQRVAYNMHLRIHTGIKPHECPTCGKSFSRKMLLKQHQRVHTGERPYTCPECGKSFADRSNMSLHARLHTGVKPYACTLCPKSFTKKHHLKTHMNFHTGLKPYTCQNCGLAFSQSSNMRTHYKKCILKDNLDINVQNAA